MLDRTHTNKAEMRMGVVHSAAVDSSPLFRTGLLEDQKVAARSIEQVHEIRRHPVLCPNSQIQSYHSYRPEMGTPSSLFFTFHV